MQKLIVACLGLAAAACGGGNLEGQYRLVGTQNDTLPITLLENSGCASKLIGGLVDFQIDGRYNSAFQIVRTCKNTQDFTQENPGVMTGHYMVEGDSITFMDGSGKPNGSGTRHGRDTVSIRGPKYTLRYVRTKSAR